MQRGRRRLELTAASSLYNDQGRRQVHFLHRLRHFAEDAAHSEEKLIPSQYYALLVSNVDRSRKFPRQPWPIAATNVLTAFPGDAKRRKAPLYIFRFLRSWQQKLKRKYRRRRPSASGGVLVAYCPQASVVGVESSPSYL